MLTRNINNQSKGVRIPFGVTKKTKLKIIKIVTKFEMQIDGHKDVGIVIFNALK